MDTECVSAIVLDEEEEEKEESGMDAFEMDELNVDQGASTAAIPTKRSSFVWDHFENGKFGQFKFCECMYCG